MTNKIALPETTLLIYGLAVADALTITYALVMLDGVTHDPLTRWIIILRGVAIGIVGGLVLAITANRIAYKTGLPRKIGAVMFALVLVAVAVIVAPVTYSAMSPVIVAVVSDPVRVAMSVASGVLVPALTAAAAATAGKLDAPAAHVPATGEQTAGSTGEPKRTAPAVVAQVAPVIEQPPAEEPQPIAQVDKPKLTDESLLEQIAQDPQQTQAQLAQVFGVTPQAISARLAKMKESGKVK